MVDLIFKMAKDYFFGKFIIKEKYNKSEVVEIITPSARIVGKR